MLLLTLLFACPAPTETDTDAGDTDVAGYPLDDVLTLYHVQTRGTHNSYHVAEANPTTAFDYTHAPIAEQLETQVVRHLEFDVERDPGTGDYLVRHLYPVDDETRCLLLTDCIGAAKTWSDANPGHVPLVILLEIKQGYVPSEAQGFLDGLEAAILGVWPRDRLITPDDVQGDAASLAAAVPDGWPTLGEGRGKALFVLFDINGDHRPVYTENDTTTEGRLLFPIGDGTLGSPVIAMHWIDDPVADAAKIEAAVAAGHLVRTRADADNVEPFAGDTARAEAALASGAHLISTDYPVPVDGVDYVFELPEGGGARCNPVTAPTECTTDAVEDAELLAE